MIFPRRVRWTEGRYANVDGIPFTMPVNTHTSPALFAAFSIDPSAARAVLPGQELHPLRIWNCGVLMITVVNYLDTTIGRYVELMIGVLCTRGRSPAPRLLPLTMLPPFGTGIYIYDLPVSTEISVKGGRGIWGMAKRQANLDFVIGGDTVSSQYDWQGQLALRIDVPKRGLGVPFFMRGAGYGDFRGMLTKSRIYMKGRTAFSLRPEGKAALLLGDHPRMDPLKRLDIDPRPLFTGYSARIEGVLDDHVETWYLTADQPPPVAAEGMKDVVGLGLSQEWLEPPDRELSDRLMRELTPDQRVGRVPRPASPKTSPERRSAS